MAHNNIAIYPGSFDPITNGHVDLVKRTLRVFNRVMVVIATNPGKDGCLFTLEERLQMVREVFKGLKNRVQADSFEGLLVDYAERKGATVIIRGLRAVSDFEYEFQMAMMNRKLDPELETLFMMPAEKYTYVSSRLIKGVFQLGGDVTALVPPLVVERLKAKVPNRL